MPHIINTQETENMNSTHKTNALYLLGLFSHKERANSIYPENKEDAPFVDFLKAREKGQEVPDFMREINGEWEAEKLHEILTQMQAGDYFQTQGEETQGDSETISGMTQIYNKDLAAWIGDQENIHTVNRYVNQCEDPHIDTSQPGGWCMFGLIREAQAFRIGELIDAVWGYLNQGE